MAIMPGAHWTPKPVPGRARRRKGRAVIFHVAVSEAGSLYPGPNADWHFYVNKSGSIYQYIDTEFQAWAAADANADCIMVETQGGVTNPDGEAWTAAQIEALAKIAAFAHDTEGVPLRLMASSLSTERGLGYHRLGVDPWRVSGGQRWSSAYGKLCPGAKKISQMPKILTRAQQIAGTNEEEPLSAAEVKQINDWTTACRDTLASFIRQEIRTQVVARLTEIDAQVGPDAVQPPPAE